MQHVIAVAIDHSNPAADPFTLSNVEGSPRHTLQCYYVRTMLEYVRLIAGGSRSDSANLGDTQLLLVRAGVVAAILLLLYLIFRRK